MLDIQINKYGNLELSIPEEADRQEIADELEKGALHAWNELMEPYYCNGQYYHVNPEDIGALTDDPYLLTDDLEYEDDGTVNVKGEVWHYTGYMIYSVVEELLQGKTVIFHKA